MRASTTQARTKQVSGEGGPSILNEIPGAFVASKYARVAVIITSCSSTSVLIGRGRRASGIIRQVDEWTDGQTDGDRWLKTDRWRQKGDLQKNRYRDTQIDRQMSR